MLFVFLIDTSASMNALMADGLSHLDCAKSGVEYFIKKRNNQRDDKYMVLTYAEGTDSIK
ncbi:hypothetical protein IWQ60_009541, partial [Tieghemiomyces parasiticus]